MGTIGLFTRTAAVKKRGTRSAKGRDPLEAARRLGARAVARMNPRAATPNIQPHGKGSAVCVLLLAPSRQDDEDSELCTSDHDARIFDRVAEYTDDDCYADAACRTFPPAGRRPTVVELEAFRADVLAEIHRRKPRVVVAVGAHVLNWISAGINYSYKEPILIHRGRVFATLLDEHPCWVIPVYSAYDAKRYFEAGTKGDERIGGGAPEEHRRAFKRDLKIIADVIQWDPPRIAPQDKTVLLRDSKLFYDGFTKSDFEKYNKTFGNLIEFDFESAQLRPYGPSHAGPSTISVSDGKVSFAVVLDHVEASAKAQRTWKSSLKWVLELFRGREVVAHNLTHDLEWAVFHFGNEIINYPKQWHCSEVAAYCFDPRVGTKLDYLCRMLFGLKLKDLSPDESWKERHALRQLLEYNVLDSKCGIWVFKYLRKMLKTIGMYAVYLERAEKIPAIVLAQLHGMQCSQARVQKMSTKLLEDIVETEKKLFSFDEINEFEKRTRRKFNPQSSDDCVILLRDILKRNEGLRKNGKYSTDKAVLQALELIEPVAKYMLKLRDLRTKHSRYIVRFMKDDPNSYVFPDGLLHSSLRITGTTTGRLASNDPNLFNFPKRKGTELRRIVKARRGYKIVSCDLGQIEARVFAMISEDKAFCDALWKGYDIHMEQAKILLKLQPNLLKLHDLSDMDKWRNIVKNAVFAAFFGGGVPKLMMLLRTTRSVTHEFMEQFWDTFSGIRIWQRAVQDFYRENFYVETMQGFRRYGPMNYNRIINTPIQGTAADFCLEGMATCARLSLERDCPWLAPFSNIYDDLLFHVPEDKVDELVEVVVPAMIDLPHEFINVPLACEVQVGDDWGSQTTYGKFRSDQL